MKHMSFRLPESAHRQLTELAGKWQVDLAYVLRSAVSQALADGLRSPIPDTIQTPPTAATIQPAASTTTPVQQPLVQTAYRSIGPGPLPDGVEFVIARAPRQSAEAREAFRLTRPDLADLADDDIDDVLHVLGPLLSRILRPPKSPEPPKAQPQPASQRAKPPIHIDGEIEHIHGPLIEGTIAADIARRQPMESLNLCMSTDESDELSLQKNAQPSLEQRRLEFRHRFRVDPSVADAVIDEQLRRMP